MASQIIDIQFHLEKIGALIEKTTPNQFQNYTINYSEFINGISPEALVGELKFLAIDKGPIFEVMNQFTFQGETKLIIRLTPAGKSLFKV